MQAGLVGHAQFAGDVEPQSGAFAGGGEERPEQLFGHAVGDARSAVGDVERRVALFVGIGADPDPRRFARHPPVHQRVVHQRGEHLLQLAAIHHRRDGAGRCGGVQLVVVERMAVAILLGEVADEAGQFHLLGLRAFAPGQAEHVFDDAVHAQGLLVDDFQQAAVGFGNVARFLQQLGRVADRGQRIADLVGQAGGEAAEGGQGQRFGAARQLRGVVEEHQHLLALRQQAGEARQDFRQVGGELQRLRIRLALVAPALEARGELRGGQQQVAPAVVEVAQLQHRRLVGQLDLASAIHQQHAGAHAADDQLVDLGEVGHLAAAAFGQLLAGQHLPADLVGQGGHGHVAGGEHHDFGQRPGRRAVAEQAPQVFARKRCRCRRRHSQAQPDRQQERGRADVEQQHHRDPGAGVRQRMHRQHGGHDVGRRADQRLGADFATTAAGEQDQRRNQVGDRHHPAEQGMARFAHQPADRTEQHQAEQGRLEHAIQGEQVQLATDGVLRAFAGGRVRHWPEVCAMPACRNATR